jgi:hypothetical protein
VQRLAILEAVINHGDCESEDMENGPVKNPRRRNLGEMIFSRWEMYNFSIVQGDIDWHYKENKYIPTDSTYRHQGTITN